MRTHNARHGLHAALREHVASGKPITRLEALVFFGVANLPDSIASLRDEGWLIDKRTVSFARAVKRINEHTVFRAPEDLPIRDIQLTEYQASF